MLAHLVHINSDRSATIADLFACKEYIETSSTTQVYHGLTLYIHLMEVSAREGILLRWMYTFLITPPQGLFEGKLSVVKYTERLGTYRPYSS